MHLLAPALLALGASWTVGVAAEASAADSTTNAPLFGMTGTGGSIKPPLDLSLTQFLPELGIILVFVLFGVCYLRGARYNRQAAQTIAAALKPYFESQFSYLGNGETFVMEDDPSSYILYGSGRRHCISATGYLQLLGRHDLLRSVLSWFTYSTDTLELEVTLPAEEIPPFVFGLVPHKDAKSVVTTRYDIVTFTTQTKLDIAPAAEGASKPRSRKYAVFSESDDHYDQLLDQAGLHQFLESPNCALQELFISDQPLNKPESLDQPPRRVVQAVIRIDTLPNSCHQPASSLVDTVSFVFQLVDFVATRCKVRASVTAKLAKARTDAVKDLTKEEKEMAQERLQRKKAEKKREIADKVTKMTPEAQRKWEEKERKRALKKKQSKLTRRA
ncbi:Coiled-coil domain-containing protein 47 [Dimargaris xerosporica]|nr:Coiled-coil domain-containing protein 47 [Dimargaris xerosporica]